MFRLVKRFLNAFNYNKQFYVAFINIKQKNASKMLTFFMFIMIEIILILLFDCTDGNALIVEQKCFGEFYHFKHTNIVFIL